MPDGLGHDDCNATIQDLLRLNESQRALLKATTDSLIAANKTIETLNSLIALAPTPPPEKRGRGRPKKVTDDTWLLEAFNEMKAEYVAANKRLKPTDDAVLTWYFGEMFRRYGSRASKAKSAAFQGKLKRFKNRLGDVRNPIRKTPI